MKSAPLVSIIIPNYNHEKFLAERIESVLSQTFQDFEIIIIDDASTDLSREVLKNYSNQPQISHFIINGENSGSPFGNWYKGIKLAVGKYIWIAETDDFAESFFLERTIFEIQNKENTVLVYTDSKIIDSNGFSLGFWSDNKNSFFKTQKWSHDYSVNGLDEILDFLLYRVTINNVSAILFNKFFLEKINFEKLEKFKNAGDLYTYISLALQGNISYISSPLNNYREHSNNISKVNTRNGIIYRELLECFEIVLDFLKENKFLSNKEKARMKKALYFFINKNAFHLFDFGYYKQFRLFIEKCRRLGIINNVQEIEYIIASKLYNLNIYRSKGLSRRIIKKYKTSLQK